MGTNIYTYMIHIYTYTYVTQDCTDLHPLKSMHPMSTRSFDVVKTFGEVSMRRSRKISSQTLAGWIQYPKPVINEKQTNNRSNHIMIKWKSSLKLVKEK